MAWRASEAVSAQVGNRAPFSSDCRLINLWPQMPKQQHQISFDIDIEYVLW